MVVVVEEELELVNQAYHLYSTSPSPPSQILHPHNNLPPTTPPQPTRSLDQEAEDYMASAPADHYPRSHRNPQ